MDKHSKPISGGVSRSPQWIQHESGRPIFSFKLGNNTFHPQILKNMGDWKNIENYLKSCPDIRSTVCFKCGASAGSIYDKNNVGYKISRSLTLKEVKLLVEEIRKINES